MCGRFALLTMPEVLADYFDLSEIPRALTPRYSIAPTQPIATIRVRGGDAGAGAGSGRAHRELEMMRWGLVPSWADDPSIGNRMINARAESAAEKPAFRHAFRKRRCLIPASAFYEWKRLNADEAARYGITGKAPKLPVIFKRRDDLPFAFAGLWEFWKDKSGSGEAIVSCTILTTAPNELCREVHDRMPVTLDPVDYDAWLDPRNQEVRSLMKLLGPCPADDLEVQPVGPRINRPENDDPFVIEPLKAGSEAGLFG